MAGNMGELQNRKILFLIPTLKSGGAERVMATLANEWCKENDITFLLFDNEIFYYIEPEVHVKYMGLMPRKGKWNRRFSIPVVEHKRCRYIYDEIKNGQYDFVLSFCGTTNIFASIVSILQKDKKIIVSERANLASESRLMRMFAYCLYRKTKAVICQNNKTREHFVQWNFRNHLLVLPNPVNFSDIPDKRCHDFRKEIVTVGRLCKEKNHKLLIEAFSEVSNDYPEYILKIYGEGELKKELRDMIWGMGLDSKVKLMGTSKKVMEYVDQSAVFVLSSDTEGFPNALVEAMAVGMPVISSRFATGVAEELITDGENGYLFNVGDRAGLVSALRKLLAREGEFLSFADKNRKVAEQYRDSVIAARWLSDIDRICS